MDQLLNAGRAFAWFLYQSSAVGGLGTALFWIPFLLSIASLAFAFHHSDYETRPKFWFLLALPAMWIFIGLWGGYFWIDWAKKPFVPNPAWVLLPVRWGIWVFLLLGIAAVAYLQGGRWFAAIFFVINLYFMLSMLLLSGMAITGDWL
jgi:hypothetical protein